MSSDDQNDFEDEDRLAENELEEGPHASTDGEVDFVEDESVVELETATISGKQPLRKKRAEFQARQKIEEYFDRKKMEHELDYLTADLEQNKEKHK